MTEDARLARARALVDLQRWPAATRLLRGVVAEQPESAEAWCLLALSYGGAKRQREALAAAQRAVSCGPDDEWAHRVLSSRLHGLGRHPEAIAAARRAVTLAPGEWRAYIAYAQALVGSPTPENLGAARASVDRALQIAPQEATVHLVDGNVADASGDFQRSQQAWRTALALDPTNSGALHNTALDDMQRGRSDAAIRGFAGAAALDPDDDGHPEHVGLAVDSVLWRLGRRYALIAVVYLAVLGPQTPIYGWRWQVTTAALAAMAVIAWRTLRRLPPAIRRVILRRRKNEDTGTALWVVAVQVAVVAVPGYLPSVLSPTTTSSQGLLAVAVFSVLASWFAAAASILSERRRPWVARFRRLLLRRDRRARDQPARDRRARDQPARDRQG
jgi:tetratricopeptide (TPR) repeat protein